MRRLVTCHTKEATHIHTHASAHAGTHAGTHARTHARTHTHTVPTQRQNGGELGPVVEGAEDEEDEDEEEAGVARPQRLRVGGARGVEALDHVVDAHRRPQHRDAQQEGAEQGVVWVLGRYT